MKTQLSLRVRLNRLQTNSRNQFPEKRAFGCHGKRYFPENVFLLTEIFSLDHGNPFQFLFSLQLISGTGDAQGRTSELTALTTNHPSRDRDRHERCFARSRRRSRSRGASSDASRDRERCFAHRRSRERCFGAVDLANGASPPSIAPVLLGFVSVFLGFASSFFISKHQKIFSEKNF